MTTDILLLVLYSACWALTLYFYLRRTKYFGAGSFVLSSFLVYSIISLYLYTRDWYYCGGLHLFPFIYLYGCIMIAAAPILRYNETKVATITPPSTTLLHAFSLIYIFCALMTIPNILSNMTMGIQLLLVDEDVATELYKDYGESKSAGGYGYISNLFTLLFNVFSDVSIILFYYYIAFFPKKKWFIAGYSLAIVTQLLLPLSQGGRTKSTLCLLTLLIGYITMRRFFSEKAKKSFAILGVSIAVLFLLLILSISYARFGNRAEGVGSGVWGYLGQGNLNFNEYVINADGTRHGDRTANTFKYLLGINHAPDEIHDVRSRYSRLGINDSVFYTFVGDFVLDYGAIMTVFIFAFFSVVFCKITKIRKGEINMSQLIALFFCMCVVTQGGFYLFSFSFNGNLRILAFLLLYIYFQLDTLSHRRVRV